MECVEAIRGREVVRSSCVSVWEVRRVSVVLDEVEGRGAKGVLEDVVVAVDDFELNKD